MGLSPSEKTKVLKDIKDLGTQLNAEVEARGGLLKGVNERIDAVLKRIDKLTDKVNQLYIDIDDIKEMVPPPIPEASKKAKAD